MKNVSTDLRQLRHFVALARTLNYRKAAERLHMAQPPLSASIRKLEDQLGVQLFERNRRGTALTAAGAQALAHAEMALHHANQFAQVARAAALGERGVLRVGFVGSATFDLLPRLVRQMQAELPQIDLDLSENTSTEICAQLLKGGLDAGLLRYPQTVTPGVALTPLHQDHLIAVVHVSHPLAQREQISLSDLRDEALIQYSQTLVPGMHTMIAMACQQAGFEPRVQQHASQVQTLVSLVQAGLGIALVPAVVARMQASNVKFIELLDARHMPATGIALALAHDRESPITARLRQLLLASDGMHEKSALRRLGC